GRAAIVRTPRAVQTDQERELRVIGREEAREGRRGAPRLVAPATDLLRRARLPRDPERAQARLTARARFDDLDQHRADLPSDRLGDDTAQRPRLEPVDDSPAP